LEVKTHSVSQVYILNIQLYLFPVIFIEVMLISDELRDDHATMEEEISVIEEHMDEQRI